ncbi:tetratricopeptide repeat protein [Nonlabens xiamenensis]|uniref:tetratricopeptide repeat protein n=1 Tax=Nonlabens xiamenensis TaxID=2341043 RepID=UPI000F60DA43|nr:tetratricopeptide repeat protein [Nonlabens xiamenensis]
MQEASYDRIILLYEQGRYKHAEDLLKVALQEDPNDVTSLHLMAAVHLALDRPKDAKHFIDLALGIAPYMDQLYSTKARIMIDVERYDEAEGLLKEAININPSEAGHFAQLAQIKLARKEYAEAENLSDKALSLEPDNLLALNTKSTAQLKQHKKAESEETLRGALGENPEDSYTHSNYGWHKLETGQHKQALEHFKQALRYDPNNGYAQAGMMQALQSKYFFYRWFLKYQFWLGNMGAKYQWGFIIGFYLGMRVLDYLSESIPALSPVLTPIVILLAIVALSTWIIGPVSQLLFSFNKYAKFLLEPKEKQAVWLTGICIIVFLAGVGAYLLTDDFRYAMIAVAGLILMIPWSMFYMETKPRNLMPLAAGIMTIIAGIAIYLSFKTGDIANPFVIGFLVSFFAFQWLVNAVVIRRDNI